MMSKSFRIFVAMISVAVIGISLIGHAVYAQEITHDATKLNTTGTSTKARELEDHNPESEDTEFGEYLYNEASVPTRLEVLRLLSKETPSTLVFLQAISMGLGLEEVLGAAANFQPRNGNNFAQSAISIIPLVSESSGYLFEEYELEDLERDEDTELYTVKEVAERFFDDRAVLVPYPDWIDGAYHFDASAIELREFARQSSDVKWYRSRSTQELPKRPIFVSFYERDESILVDGYERIEQAIKADGPTAVLPVVFVYNKANELPIDSLEYPKTLVGVQRAFTENSLMVTPSPEWQVGDYILDVTMQELYEIFDLPEEDDFEPEHWSELLEEAEHHRVNDISFIAVILPSGDAGDDDQSRNKRSINGVQLAQWDDPREEARFPYVAPDGEKDSINHILDKGIIITRPDLIVALNTLGVNSLPVSIYYIHNSRVRQYIHGPRRLLGIVQGSQPPANHPHGGGFGPPPECASPPCLN